MLLVEVMVPKLGLSIQTATVVSWNKKEGELLKKGEILLTIETEKVTFDVPSPADGLLKRIISKPGDVVEVGAKIAELESGETGVLEPTPVSETMPSVAPPMAESERLHRVLSTPRARRLAREKGVDISKVTGTGRNGMVTEHDIIGYSESIKGTQGPTKRIPLVGTRGTIAARMTKSAQTIPQVTLHQTCKATKLMDAKKILQIKDLSFDAIYIRILSTALKEFPIFNAVVENNEIRLTEDQNIAVAIGLGTGLIAPVVKNVQSMDLSSIAQSVSVLSEKARNNQLVPEDMIGGTFTISNLGMYETDFFNPLINPPQVAILGIGRIRRREGSIEEYETTLSLTFDHRAIDGHLAAQFLRRVCELTEGFSEPT